MGGAAELQYGFIKDSIFGTLCVVLFSSFGWDQWKISLAHAASIPCVFLAVEFEKTDELALYGIRLCALCAAAVAFADLVVVLTLLCAFGHCCEAPTDVAPFAPTVDVCGSQSLDRATLSALAIATVAIGGAQSAARAVSASGNMGKHGPLYAKTALYAALRVYEFSWTVVASPGIPIVLLWAAGLVFALIPAVLHLRRFRAVRKAHPRLVAWIPAGALACDAGALVLFFQASVPVAVRLAGRVVQSAAALVALSQAWTALFVGR